MKILWLQHFTIYGQSFRNGIGSSFMTPSNSMAKYRRTLERGYYPFGLAHSVNNMGKDKYLFGREELQDEVIDGTLFGMLDFGARFYDPLVPHWWTVDPLAEKGHRWSSYNYAFDNPIRFVDPLSNKTLMCSG